MKKYLPPFWSALLLLKKKLKHLTKKQKPCTFPFKNNHSKGESVYPFSPIKWVNCFYVTFLHFLIFTCYIKAIITLCNLPLIQFVCFQEAENWPPAQYDTLSQQQNPSILCLVVCLEEKRKKTKEDQKKKKEENESKIRRRRKKQKNTHLSFFSI